MRSCSFELRQPLAQWCTQCATCGDTKLEAETQAQWKSLVGAKTKIHANNPKNATTKRILFL